MDDWENKLNYCVRYSEYLNRWELGALIDLQRLSILNKPISRKEEKSLSRIYNKIQSNI